jgi:AraC-like DNA-binding protein
MLRYLAQGLRNFATFPDQAARRTCWEFFAVLEGSIRPDYGKEYPSSKLQQNCLYLTRPNCSYKWLSGKQPVQRVVFHFSSIPNILENECNGQNFVIHRLNPQDRELIIELANMLQPYYLKPTELLELYSQKALIELSLLFLEGADFRQMRPLHRKEFERVRKAEEWYLSKIKSRPTIEAVAAAVNISSSQLRRDFYEVYKMAPQLVFRRLRLYEATRLLSNSDWSIEEIHREAGFASKVDFHRSFKSEYNFTPYQWRRRESILS